jgi:hypothetical protein
VAAAWIDRDWIRWVVMFPDSQKDAHGFRIVEIEANSTFVNIRTNDAVITFGPPDEWPGEIDAGEFEVTRPAEPPHVAARNRRKCFENAMRSVPGSSPRTGD